MELEEYLKGLQQCPNDLVDFVDCTGRKISRLTAEFGIYDNFPIALEANFDKLMEVLKGSYDYIGIGKFTRTRKETFKYSHGGIFYTSPTTEIIEKIFGLDKKKDLKKMIERLNTSLIINAPYNRGSDKNASEIKKLSQVEEAREIANLVIDIAKISIDNKFPLCLLRSTGWNHKEDYSRIVSYNL